MSEGRIDVVDMSSDDMAAMTDVVNAKLDGVGFHVAMYSQCLGGGLCDMAKLHKERAEDEFEDLLKAIGVYVSTFKQPPRLYMTDPGVKPVNDRQQAIDAYDEWETETFKKLRQARSSISGCKAYVTTLIHDVMDELLYIDKIK